VLDFAYIDLKLAQIIHKSTRIAKGVKQHILADEERNTPPADETLEFT
jgi:hypothetical protein